MPLQPTHKDAGFTLFEVITVLALITVFTVLAIVRHSASDATLVAQTQVLASHIRYAQMRALNTETSWGIFYNYNAANPQDCYYHLFRGSNTADIAQLPGESQNKVIIGGMGISISSAPPAGTPSARSFRISFDSWGRPTWDITGIGAGSETLTLRLAKSGQTPQDIRVTQNTGFIP